jgi:hypothetical protein
VRQGCACPPCSRPHDRSMRWKYHSPHFTGAVAACSLSRYIHTRSLDRCVVQRRTQPLSQNFLSLIVAEFAPCHPLPSPQGTSSTNFSFAFQSQTASGGLHRHRGSGTHRNRFSKGELPQVPRCLPDFWTFPRCDVGALSRVAEPRHRLCRVTALMMCGRVHVVHDNSKSFKCSTCCPRGEWPFYRNGRCDGKSCYCCYSTCIRPPDLVAVDPN